MEAIAYYVPMLDAERYRNNAIEASCECTLCKHVKTKFKCAFETLRVLEIVCMKRASVIARESIMFSNSVRCLCIRRLIHGLFRRPLSIALEIAGHRRFFSFCFKHSSSHLCARLTDRMRDANVFVKNKTQFSRCTMDAIVASVHALDRRFKLVSHSFSISSIFPWTPTYEPIIFDRRLHSPTPIAAWWKSIFVSCIIAIDSMTSWPSRSVSFRSICRFLWVVLFASLRLDRVIYYLIGCTKEQKQPANSNERWLNRRCLLALPWF